MNGRIPEAFIDEVIARTDLVELIQSRVNLKKSGKNYVACCPFHEEKTPSFTVSPDKQFYYCFGCGASGNAIGFMMDYERHNFVDAIKNLAQSSGLEVPLEPRSAEKSQQFQKLLEALARAENYYQQQLQHAQNKRPRAYLRDRGLSDEIIKLFKLGYAEPGWDNLSSQFQSTQQLQIAELGGLIINKDGARHYDRFRDRIMFPIRDPRGRTVAFGGRVLGDEKPKYLNSPETPVFHKQEVLYGLHEYLNQKTRAQKFLIVEGYLDVISLYQYDITYAVATLGTATSKSHLEKLFRYAPEVIFCFDGDSAGQKAAERALSITLSTLRDGRQVKFLFLPDGEDPDSLIKKEGREHFQTRIDNAVPLSEFFFDALEQQVNTQTVDGRARLAAIAMPLIEQIPTGFYKQLMTQQLAQLSGIDQSTLHKIAEQQSKTKVSPTTSSPQGQQRTAKPQNITTATETPGATTKQDPKPAATPSQRLTEKTIRLILQSPEKAQQISLPQEFSQLPSQSMQTLIELLDFLQKHPNSTIASLVGYWHGTETGNRVAQIAAQEFLLAREHIEDEIQDAILQLKRLHITELISRQIDEDRQNKTKDGSKLKKLLDLKQEISNL